MSRCRTAPARFVSALRAYWCHRVQGLASRLNTAAAMPVFKQYSSRAYRKPRAEQYWGHPARADCKSLPGGLGGHPPIQFRTIFECPLFLPCVVSTWANHALRQGAAQACSSPSHLLPWLQGRATHGVPNIIEFWAKFESRFRPDLEYE